VASLADQHDTCGAAAGQGVLPAGGAAGVVHSRGRLRLRYEAAGCLFAQGLD